MRQRDDASARGFDRARARIARVFERERGLGIVVVAG
jgi:hypothetical protein